MQAISKSVYRYPYYELLPTMVEAQISGFQLMSIYNSIYFSALQRTADDGSGGSFYNEWLRHTDKGLGGDLRSDSFTSLLSRCVDSIVELHSIFRKAGFPVNYFDAILGSYFRNLAPLSLMSGELELSPSDVVFTKGKSRLLHYRSAGDKSKHNTGPPLLVIYAPVNRYHILDLNRHKSVIKNLLSHGLDVYLLDWGYPSYEDNDLSLSDYLGYVRASVRAIRDDMGEQSARISILGYCWGGVIGLIYSSLHSSDVKSLALMATPVDFSKDDTILGIWLRAIDTDKIVNEYGQMDGQALDMSFLMRNPPRYAFGKYLKFFERLHDQEFVQTFLDVERWLYDTPPIPGNLYRQIINDCYKKNLLASDRMEIITRDNDGGGIDKRELVYLKKITAPVLSIIAERDDLVSSESSLAVNDCISSKDKAVLTNHEGHVALCVSNTAHKKLWPEVAKWILSRG